jgi:glyoxylase-like metal-dependent hydrolase (beta-lactamase superfamily II)
VVSHLHQDHIGGLGALGHAEIVVSKKSGVRYRVSCRRCRDS